MKITLKFVTVVFGLVLVTFSWGVAQNLPKNIGTTLNREPVPGSDYHYPGEIDEDRMKLIGLSPDGKTIRGEISLKTPGLPSGSEFLRYRFNMILESCDGRKVVRTNFSPSAPIDEVITSFRNFEYFDYMSCKLTLSHISKSESWDDGPNIHEPYVGQADFVDDNFKPIYVHFRASFAEVTDGDKVLVHSCGGGTYSLGGESDEDAETRTNNTHDNRRHTNPVHEYGCANYFGGSNDTLAFSNSESEGGNPAGVKQAAHSFVRLIKEYGQLLVNLRNKQAPDAEKTAALQAFFHNNHANLIAYVDKVNAGLGSLRLMDKINVLASINEGYEYVHYLEDKIGSQGALAQTLSVRQ